MAKKVEIFDYEKHGLPFSYGGDPCETHSNKEPHKTAKFSLVGIRSDFKKFYKSGLRLIDYPTRIKTFTT